MWLAPLGYHHCQDQLAKPRCNGRYKRSHPDLFNFAHLPVCGDLRCETLWLPLQSEVQSQFGMLLQGIYSHTSKSTLVPLIGTHCQTMPLGGCAGVRGGGARGDVGGGGGGEVDAGQPGWGMYNGLA